MNKAEAYELIGQAFILKGKIAAFMAANPGVDYDADIIDEVDQLMRKISVMVNTNKGV